jgi:hypothetical protein
MFQICLHIFCLNFIAGSGLHLVRSPKFIFVFGPADGQSVDYMTNVISLILDQKSMDSLYSTFIGVKLLNRLKPEIHPNIILKGNS